MKRQQNHPWKRVQHPAAFKRWARVRETISVARGESPAKADSMPPVVTSAVAPRDPLNGHGNPQSVASPSCSRDGAEMVRATE